MDEQAAKPTIADLRNIRILIVDDFEMILIFLQNALTKFGFTRVVSARDGVSAILRLKEGVAENDPYSIIFCDWKMPGASGLDVLMACKSNRNLKNVPFIMITAENERNKVIEALSAGATDYIVKPISPAILQKKLIRILTQIRQKAA